MRELQFLILTFAVVLSVYFGYKEMQKINRRMEQIQSKVDTVISSQTYRNNFESNPQQHQHTRGYPHVTQHSFVAGDNTFEKDKESFNCINQFNDIDHSDKPVGNLNSQQEFNNNIPENIELTQHESNSRPLDNPALNQLLSKIEPLPTVERDDDDVSNIDTSSMISEIEAEREHLNQDNPEETRQPTIKELNHHNQEESSQQNLEELNQQNLEELNQQNLEELNQQNLEESSQQNIEESSQQNLEESSQQNQEELNQQNQDEGNGNIDLSDGESDIFTELSELNDKGSSSFNTINDGDHEVVDSYTTLTESDTNLIHNVHKFQDNDSPTSPELDQFSNEPLTSNTLTEVYLSSLTVKELREIARTASIAPNKKERMNWFNFY